MSVGLMRSVDTSTLAVGNMAFRQAAEATANQAIEAAIRNLGGGGIATNGDASPYFASYNPANDDARGIPANRLAGLAGTTDTASGNVYRTVIERMCTAAGALNPPAVTCLTTGGGAGGLKNIINQGNERQDDLNIADGDSGGGGDASILYRVSVRVDGPNGTVAYAQAMASL
ncbi:MAG: hypothetical protein LBE15_06315 [Burkholderiales bacterium]|nr:hypothetical protein [Burkholderiales bacterium]